MHFETMILLLFSVLGLIDGALFALLFRRRRFYFYALAMALLGGAAGAYFLWYAKGYDGLGLWSLYLAYGMTGFMVAEIIALFLLVPLSLLSLVKALRRAARLLGGDGASRYLCEGSARGLGGVSLRADDRYAYRSLLPLYGSSA